MNIFTVLAIAVFNGVGAVYCLNNKHNALAVANLFLMAWNIASACGLWNKR